MDVNSAAIYQNITHGKNMHIETELDNRKIPYKNGHCEKDDIKRFPEC